mgnify:FL=1
MEALQVIRDLPIVDELLERHAAVLGSNRRAYTNHVYRVVNLCAELAGHDADTLQKLGIAGVFHDIGLFADGTFDYLEPSRARAHIYLEETGLAQWRDEVGAMVYWHHKINPVPKEMGPFVEAFRKADWIDVLHGAITCGIPRSKIREIFNAFPNSGFHWLLVKLSVNRLLTHPWNPLPILRW